MHHLVLTGQAKRLGVKPEIVELDPKITARFRAEGGDSDAEGGKEMNGITVGRSRQKCDVILGSTRGPLMISRVHATIVPVQKEGESEPRWKLIDHSSRNGTFVNNMKVSEVVLEHGDSITFGGGGLLPYGSMKHQIDSEFTYTYVEGSARVKKTADWCRLSGRLERKSSKKNAASLNSRKRTLLLAGKIPNSKKRLRMKGPKSSNDEMPSSSPLEGQTTTATDPLPLATKTSATKEEEEEEDEASRAKKKRGQELLHKEFTCPVCLDYFVQTRTLACGHSFCSPCLSNCLEHKRQCPVCRETVSKNPVRSCALDGAIRALVQQEKKGNERHQKRLKQWKNDQRKERRTATKLRSVIQKAKDEGKHFLSIHDRWNHEERDLFRRGVIMYRGPARVEYCRTTDLTADFIDSKMFRELIDVAANVGIVPEDGARIEREFSSLSVLRDRLHMFILYG